VRLQHAQLPEEARELDKELRALNKEKDAAVRGQDFEKAGSVSLLPTFASVWGGGGPFVHDRANQEWISAREGMGRRGGGGKLRSSDLYVCSDVTILSLEVVEIYASTDSAWSH